MARRGALVAVLLLGLASCGGGESGTRRGAEGGPRDREDQGVIDVRLSEWEVAPDPSSTDAGRVEFRAENAGKQPHELVVIKTMLAPDQLPVEGGVVKTEATGLDEVGEIEEFPANESKTGSFDLATAKYVLICNLPGHYQQGMRTSFAVR